MTAKSDIHWQKTRRLTFVLVVFWIFVNFGLTWFAREINDVTILGFPLGFYMAAQGTLVINLMIIWWYNRQMNILDTKYGIEDD